ncbi:uridine kinase [Lactobacillus johnsonii]|uniref:Uridine kinase n=1 Tax=Lactobacillus johnsonii TaxID=33959 RepID=A0AAX0PU57_LACJH|nr:MULTISPECIES: kinase [Lactobacillus]ARW75030.1 uridine kinase [Lactobacillus johnsonii]ARW77010.1 uridine kinase [Lactobacillus johnsonii]PAB46309.1 uridine kinase [Lactobacillus johnsonii]PAB52257.1 uridine kinase [Lactobacillus johnsonii]PEG77056.1 uridine kinase [Lactobacillus sp. UMNPBX19]
MLSKLIIVRGNSGSGKTTLAKEIYQRLPRNTLLISQDTVRRDMLRVKDGENTLGLPLFEDLLHYGYRNCDYVILEGILNAEWYLPLFRQAEKLFGEEIFAYYFDISFEETLMRHKQRNISSFGEKQMHSWWKEKDYINFISETKFSSRTTLRQEIEKIMKDIGYVNNH